MYVNSHSVNTLRVTETQAHWTSKREKHGAVQLVLSDASFGETALTPPSPHLCVFIQVCMRIEKRAQ